MKKNLKWIILAVVLVAAVILVFGCREKGTMEAVSEDGLWEAYAFESKEDGKNVWKGAVVYTGENPDNIKNVRTQRGVNGVMKKFAKRALKEAGTDGVKSSDIGGADYYYTFMVGDEKKPVSLSVKVKWKEDGKTKTEKLWLLDQ